MPMMTSHSKQCEFSKFGVGHVKRRQNHRWILIEFVLLTSQDKNQNWVVTWYGPPDIPRGVSGRRADRVGILANRTRDRKQLGLGLEQNLFNINRYTENRHIQFIFHKYAKPQMTWQLGLAHWETPTKVMSDRLRRGHREKRAWQVVLTTWT